MWLTLQYRTHNSCMPFVTGYLIYCIFMQAYRQRVSSSVQIARIAALTVVAASFILGAFILASSWVAARASCHQLEQLDAMLDKELALEGRSYGNDALLPVSTYLPIFYLKIFVNNLF